jgi:hypothetical protein
LIEKSAGQVNEKHSELDRIEKKKMIERSRKNNFNIGETKNQQPAISSTKAAFRAYATLGNGGHVAPDFKSSNFQLGQDKADYMSTNNEMYNLKRG